MTTTTQATTLARRIRLGPRAYALSDLRAIGRDHGEAGRAAFPPHLWVGVGDSSEVAEAVIAYQQGYAEGKELAAAWVRLWERERRDARRGRRGA